MYRQNMNNSNYVSTSVFSFYKRLPLGQSPMAILSRSFCLSVYVFMTLLFPRGCFPGYCYSCSSLARFCGSFCFLSLSWKSHGAFSCCLNFFSALKSWLCLRTALVLSNLSFAFWTSCIKITILLRVWGFSINIFSNKLLTPFKILMPSRASVTPKIALLFGCEVSLDFVHLSSFLSFFFCNSTFSSSLAASSLILSICSILILMAVVKFLIQFSESSLQELLWGLNCPVAVNFPC